MGIMVKAIEVGAFTGIEVKGLADIELMILIVDNGVYAGVV